MRVTRYNKGYTLHLTEAEYEILNSVTDLVDYGSLNNQQRRSYGRRVTYQKLPLLRVDFDRRTPEYKELDNETR